MSLFISIDRYKLWAKLHGFETVREVCLDCKFMKIEKEVDQYLPYCYGDWQLEKFKDSCDYAK